MVVCLLVWSVSFTHSGITAPKKHVLLIFTQILDGINRNILIWIWYYFTYFEKTEKMQLTHTNSVLFVSWYIWLLVWCNHSLCPCKLFSFSIQTLLIELYVCVCVNGQEVHFVWSSPYSKVRDMESNRVEWEW